MHNSELSPDSLVKKISTSLDWDDLVVNDELLRGIAEIKEYFLYGKRLTEDFQLSRRIKPGYRCFFAGPPGTGKELTATLLGKELNKDVFKIDLSLVVSKYIGETEKNLAAVFNKAEGKDWILFFDEADALFGKRTDVKSAHDRYANQETSYLLQRLEACDGLVILSSNLKNTIDSAFIRRFQLVLDFKIPDVNERLNIWKKIIANEFEYHSDINLEYLAENYVLTPASMVNSMQHAILKCLARDERIVRLEDLLAGIETELEK
ncbi:MAG: ATP-binding protein [Flavobacteriaceae bacterium]